MNTIKQNKADPEYGEKKIVAVNDFHFGEVVKRNESSYIPQIAL